MRSQVFRPLRRSSRQRRAEQARLLARAHGEHIRQISIVRAQVR